MNTPPASSSRFPLADLMVTLLGRQMPPGQSPIPQPDFTINSEPWGLLQQLPRPFYQRGYAPAPTRPPLRMNDPRMFGNQST